MKRVSKIDELPSSQILKITEKNTDGSFRRKVKAPLMDGFGMSVGSSFTDPASVDLAEQAGSLGRVAGSIAGTAKFVGNRMGYSTKISQRSNIWYSGPEPTEISFEMQFNSYYSAYDEVVVPAIKLMLMSVGRENKISDLNERFTEQIRASGSENNVDSSEVADIAGEFGFIKSAGICEIKFGSTFKIPRAYVSSVGVKFSNVLDNMGYPTSADCSVTVKVIRNPTQNEIGAEYFSAPGLLRNDT